MNAHEKLIRRIVPTLTHDLGKLLEYLYGKMPARVPAKEIEREHHGRDPMGEDPSRARERVKTLRQGLEAYRDQAKGERWVCDLKTDSGGAGGYYLDFTRSSGSSCREAFWEAHLDAESDVAIIKDPLLFYYQHATGKVFRYVNTNIDEPDHDLAMKELERLHPLDYSNDLMPGHFYVDIGQVRAADRLSQYFEREMNASSMICCAETTLPSSRVRSEALSTNLFNKALVGRSVIGTVSGCFAFVVFAFERVTAGLVSGVVATVGAEGVATDARMELAPAGLLAAAAIRAASSLASRLYFMRGT